MTRCSRECGIEPREFSVDEETGKFSATIDCPLKGLPGCKGRGRLPMEASGEVKNVMRSQVVDSKAERARVRQIAQRSIQKTVTNLRQNPRG